MKEKKKPPYKWGKTEGHDPEAISALAGLIMGAFMANGDPESLQALSKKTPKEIGGELPKIVQEKLLEVQNISATIKDIRRALIRVHNFCTKPHIFAVA